MLGYSNVDELPDAVSRKSDPNPNLVEVSESNLLIALQ